MMSELEDSLIYYISQRLQTRWSDLHFELSGATVAVSFSLCVCIYCCSFSCLRACLLSQGPLQGEGELKIFERILHPHFPSGLEDEIAVIGSDSDLFLMALLHKPAANLWVLPENEPRALPGLARKRLSGFSTNALDQTWKQLRHVKACGSTEVGHFF